MTTAPQRSFRRGEVAPTYHGAANLELFQEGLSTCRNMAVTSLGLSDRGGTELVAEHQIGARDLTLTQTASKLIAFRYNAEQTYMLEFGDRYMRVYRNGSPVGYGKVAITSMAEGANDYTTVTKVGHGLSDGQEIVLTGIEGARSVFNRKHYTVERIDADTFNMRDIGTGNLAYATGTTTSYGYFERVVRIDTPWHAANLSWLRARQRGDVLRMFCKNYPMYTITRTNDTTWLINEAVVGATIEATDNISIVGGTAGTGFGWAVTSINRIYEESLLSTEVARGAAASSGSPVTVNFDAADNAIFYKVYKRIGNGGWGLAGTVPVVDGVTPSFVDNGFTPDYAQSPPIEYNPFETTSIALTDISDQLIITDPVLCLDMHPSGLLIAVGSSAAPYMRMYYRKYIGGPWSLVTGSYLNDYTAAVYEVRFSPDGWKLFATCYQHHVYLYHLINTGDMVGPGFSGLIIWPPCSSEDAPFRLVRYMTDDLIPVAYYNLGANYMSETCCFSADSAHLFFKFEDSGGTNQGVKRIELWHQDVYTIYNQYIFSVSDFLAAGAQNVDRLEYAPNKGLLVVLYPDGGSNPKLSMYYKDFNTHTLLSGVPIDDPTGTTEVKFSPNGQYLAGVNSSGDIWWYTVNGSGSSATLTQQVPPSNSTLTPFNLEWSKDSKFLIVSGGVSPYVEAYRVDNSSGTLALTLVEDFASTVTVTATPGDLAWDTTGDTLFVCMPSGVNLLSLQTTYDYPYTAALFQQRLCCAPTSSDAISVNASTIGSPYNFNRRAFPQDTDAFSYTPNGNEVNEIRHLQTIGRDLACLTMGREMTISGVNDGGFSYGTVQTNVHSYNGASWVEPVSTEDALVYVQDGDKILRDMRYSWETRTYQGSDLTALAKHLFKSRSITRIAYQATPTPIVWVVMSDGELLAMSYIRDQNVLAWSRHDTDGNVVDVACVHEGDIDRVYLLIDRDCSDGRRRFLERMSDTRLDPDDYREGANFTDFAVAYDFRNTDAENTLTITSRVTGTGWAAGQFNVEFVDDTLVAADVTDSNVLFIYSGGDILAMPIVSVSSAKTCVVATTFDIPTAYQNTATAAWAKARTQLEGLGHLIGKDVSIFADGAVVACPGDSNYTTVTVDSEGDVSLEEAVAVAYVGIPYICDVQTLEIEQNSPTLVNIAKNVGRMQLRLEESLGLYGGRVDPGDDTPLTGLNPINQSVLHDLGVEDDRDYQMPYTGVVGGVIKGHWDTGGKVLLRKIHPVPWTLLSIYIPVEMEPNRG